MTNPIDAQIAQLQERHNRYLENLLSQQYFPSRVLYEAIHYALFPGGKRIRPLLVYFVGEILNISPACLDIIAAAIELTHTYSLVHDDLPAMDNDDFRRGKPSCHKAFPEGLAILAGDALQTYAIQILLQKLPLYLSAQQVLKITLILCESSGIEGMISGQCFDLYPPSPNNALDIEAQQSCFQQGTKRIEKPLERLQHTHELKTGKLIMACINMTIAAQQTPISQEAVTALRDYGRQLGFTYQIQDDYLDTYASPDLLGKNRASDLINQKNTYATYYSKKELYTRITELYHNTINTLNYFENKSAPLRQYTERLLKRDQIA